MSTADMNREFYTSRENIERNRASPLYMQKVMQVLHLEIILKEILHLHWTYIYSRYEYTQEFYTFRENIERNTASPLYMQKIMCCTV